MTAMARVCADDVAPQSDHRHTRSGCGGRHGSKCDPGLAGEAAEAGICEFHFGDRRQKHREPASPMPSNSART
jgi:hypothetical protein